MHMVLARLAQASGMNIVQLYREALQAVILQPHSDGKSLVCCMAESLYDRAVADTGKSGVYAALNK